MKKITAILSVFSFVLIFIGCQGNTLENPNDQYCELTQVNNVYKCSKAFFAFDTQLSFTLYYDRNSSFDIATIYQDLDDIFNEYDQLLDMYNAYDGLTNLYTVNHSDSPIQVSEALFDAVSYALENQNVDPTQDELLFNIALGPITEIWHNARNSEECQSTLLFDFCPVPSNDILMKDYPTNPDDVILDEENLTISFNKTGMKLDLGGFAKGYISMIAEEYLSQYEISYILNLGASNVLVSGKNISNKNGDEYNIAITKPEFEAIGSDYYGIIQVTDGYSVVSSGAYQRYFKNLEDKEDPTYYHHIIDPRTNMPGGEALAVTIITKNTGVSDILSTAIFLMDYEDGLAFVNRTDDLEAIWYFSEDDIRMSENFGDFFILK